MSMWQCPNCGRTLGLFPRTVCRRCGAAIVRGPVPAMEPTQAMMLPTLVEYERRTHPNAEVYVREDGAVVVEHPPNLVADGARAWANSFLRVLATEAKVDVPSVVNLFSPGLTKRLVTTYEAGFAAGTAAAEAARRQETV